MNNEILFKYKPISSVDQLARIIDSINNNQIFFPDYKKLNDPLESSGYVIELSGYMGKGLILAADEEDKLVLLNDLGVNESGLDKLIRATYSLLGLKTFFTAGSDEVRAWTFKDGMKAPSCAGIIHTDFERGFIKAEVMSYDDLHEFGSEKSVKENGKMRLEGKDYVMQDGDICYFRFNV